MKRILLFSILSVAAIAVTLNSCKKEEPDTDTQSAVDNNVCEGEFTSRMHVINSFGIKEQGIKSSMSFGLDTVIIDTINRRITLDFGTGSIDSIDGKIRSGQIIAKFDRPWLQVGANLTIKLVNYFVKNSATAAAVQYACDSITVTRSTLTSFSNKIIGGKCIAPSWNLEWAATRTVTQTAGASTPLTDLDDVYSITGESNGKNRNGKTFTVNITSPIVKRAICPWIESGIVELTPEGLATRTVDYGPGTCDSQGTLTINGNTFQFNMN
jgi:hypothetical protein